MADTFSFNKLAHNPERLNVISSRLGTGGIVGGAGGDPYTITEEGKPVKLAAGNAHVLAGADDEIEGFVDSINSDGTDGGYTMGGVARCNRGCRMSAVIGANQGGTPAALGDLVVCDAQVAKGTAGAAQVKTGNPTVNLWRIMSLDGDGTTGTAVIIELC